jgi:hypothetical protein
VALNAAFCREQPLAGFRVTELVAVLRRENERQDVRKLERREGWSLDAHLAHLRAHQRQVVPHRRTQVEEAGPTRDTRQVWGAPPFAAATDPVAPAAPFLRVDVPAGEQRPVGRKRQRWLRCRRLLCRDRRDREQDETAHRCHVASAPHQSRHSGTLLRVFLSHCSDRIL